MDKGSRERRQVETWARWVVKELRDDARALGLVVEVVEALAERRRTSRIV